MRTVITCRVHSRAQVAAMLSWPTGGAVALRLWSPRRVVASRGPHWFQRLVGDESARRGLDGAAVRAVVDCGDAAGEALSAFAAGASLVALSLEVSINARRRVAAIARGYGATLISDDFDGVDLGSTRRRRDLCFTLTTLFAPTADPAGRG